MVSFDIYSVKQRWKLLIFIASVFIGSGSLLYTNKLVNDLAREERKKIELWANATRLIAITSQDTELLNFLLKVTENNTTIPVILTDSCYNIIYHRNIIFLGSDQGEYLKTRLKKFQNTTIPIQIQLDGLGLNYLFYDDSYILKRLAMYPYIQLSVILIFIIASYLAFSASRKAEQNKVWVGLSRETAHQLGTPTSLLMAWVELLKEKFVNDDLIQELEHDVNRLQIITARFSNIGSQPILSNTEISGIVAKAVEYMKLRIPASVSISYSHDRNYYVPMNVNLFHWVIENLIKNGLDAIGNQGTIDIKLFEEDHTVCIDIKDSGKGLARKDFKRVFKPGYTTKSRGWGLGLSLARRIIDDYHQGKIYVLQSEIGKGTIFRIELKKNRVGRHKTPV
jgi:signal transduction histidine kinase